MNTPRDDDQAMAELRARVDQIDAALCARYPSRQPASEAARQAIVELVAKRRRG